MINSPLNYPGNKARIAQQIISLFPHDINSFFELFAGSAIISMNVKAKKYFINDTSNQVIELLKYFRQNTDKDIIGQVEKNIALYNLTNTYKFGKLVYPVIKYEGLSNYNREGYLKLREAYNKDKSLDKLFTLIIYGFNHYMRFNRKGDFNVPVGKVDYIAQLRERTSNTCNKLKNMDIIFSNLDFSSQEILDKITIEDFVYLDPPYFITEAPYNKAWTELEEFRLYKYLDMLNSRGVRFALSNVIQSNGRKNKILIDWMKKYNVHYIYRTYLNSNYRKKNLSNTQEVLITNY